MPGLQKFDRPLEDLMRSVWPFNEVSVDLPRDAWPMRVEEFREGEDLVVRAELPGVDPAQDVAITLDAGMLTISAQRREERTQGEKGAPGYRSEFRYGTFVRTVRLPEGAEEDSITATYTDGILTVRVHVATSSAEPTTIPVTRT